MQPKLSYQQASNQEIGTNILTPAASADLETIWFHNINGIKDEKNWAQIIHTMNENNIDIFGFAEINKSMDNFATNCWKSIIKKQFYLSRTIHLESATKTESEYKPGGTMTTITGKWQARVSKMAETTEVSDDGVT
jgi:hypothetical protein